MHQHGKDESSCSSECLLEHAAVVVAATSTTSSTTTGYGDLVVSPSSNVVASSPAASSLMFSPLLSSTSSSSSSSSSTAASSPGATGVVGGIGGIGATSSTTMAASSTSTSTSTTSSDNIIDNVFNGQQQASAHHYSSNTFPLLSRSSIKRPLSFTQDNRAEHVLATGGGAAANAGGAVGSICGRDCPVNHRSGGHYYQPSYYNHNHHYHHHHHHHGHHGHHHYHHHYHYPRVSTTNVSTFRSRAKTFHSSSSSDNYSLRTFQHETQQQTTNNVGLFMNEPTTGNVIEFRKKTRKSDQFITNNNNNEQSMQQHDNNNNSKQEHQHLTTTTTKSVSNVSSQVSNMTKTISNDDDEMNDEMDDDDDGVDVVDDGDMMTDDLDDDADCDMVMHIEHNTNRQQAANAASVAAAAAHSVPLKHAAAVQQDQNNKSRQVSDVVDSMPFDGIPPDPNNPFYKFNNLFLKTNDNNNNRGAGSNRSIASNTNTNNNTAGTVVSSSFSSMSRRVIGTNKIDNTSSSSSNNISSGQTSNTTTTSSSTTSITSTSVAPYNNIDNKQLNIMVASGGGGSHHHHLHNHQQHLQEKKKNLVSSLWHNSNAKQHYGKSIWSINNSTSSSSSIKPDVDDEDDVDEVHDDDEVQMLDLKQDDDEKKLKTTSLKSSKPINIICSNTSSSSLSCYSGGCGDNTSTITTTIPHASPQTPPPISPNCAATTSTTTGNGAHIPTEAEKEQFQRSLDSATTLVFHRRSGLPLTSSPAPIRKSGTCFDFDSSLTSVNAIKKALFHKDPDGKDDYVNSMCRSKLSLSAPTTTSGLLGNFEESVLNGRLDPASIVHGFTAEIGASGGFCPSHKTFPVTVFFYTLQDTDKGEKMSSPYLGHINLGEKGYHVPRQGTVQVTLFNPNGTVVKMFVVRYDLSDMPPNSRTFLRQRTLFMPSDANEHHADSRKWLRYLIHLRFQSSKSGRIRLHTDIRILVFRKHDLDVATMNGGTPYELRSFVQMPSNPKYSKNIKT